MSDIKLVSPMLDNFNIGDPISDHNGIRCCPAMRNDSDEKYIVKVISVPSSQVQYDALLLTGICSDRESALAYFGELADNIVDEIKTIQKLAELEGFLPVEDYQIVPMEDDVGYNIYVLSKYKGTLAKQLSRKQMTHLGAINLGLDLCAALSVCRKLGYIYSDLKPTNIYLSGENEYRIGDLGFIKLNSLKYASLPESYRSAYTAPEIADAYSTLNTTIDIYALGLILYQVYNGGTLPVADAETGIIPPPAYADGDMSALILKACATNIEDRWQDPIEMGQALVAYMQRNGANDTPIVPDLPDEPVEVPAPQEEAIEPATDIAEDMQEPVETPSDEVSVLDEISLLDDIADPAGEDDAESAATYDEVSEDVSGILAAADELISHPVPELTAESAEANVSSEECVEPDVYVEPEANDEDVASDTDEVPCDAVTEEPDPVCDENADEEAVVPVATDDVAEKAVEEPVADAESEEAVVANKKPAWWKVLLIALLAAGIAVAGYFYYTLCYLQPVSLQLNGYDNKLTVTVECAIDELYVICSDSYGNQHKAEVIDGIAKFDDLASNTVYTVNVDTDAFHKLTGATSVTYKTGIQTKVTQFTALNGAQSGSVVLSFSVEGNDSEQWKLYTSLLNQAEADPITFSGHMIVLDDLSVGTTYQFRLEPVTELFFDANNAITFTPEEPVKAENLVVSGFMADSLTVTWNVPEGAVVSKWIVRCYDSSSLYAEVVETSELTATFTGIDPQSIYTIDVTAEKMSEAATIAASEKVLSLHNFRLEVNEGTLTLLWDTSKVVENFGWVASYSIDAIDAQELNVSSGNRIDGIPYVPNANYTFTVKPADGTAVINNQYSVTSDAAPVFENYGITAEHIRFDMCKRPSVRNWTYRNLVSSDYTTTFSANGKASFLLSIPYEFKEPDDAILIAYVIYDENGGYVSYSAQQDIWSAMWDRGYCELDIPSIPSAAGTYKIAVYFNGALANETNFTITR